MAIVSLPRIDVMGVQPNTDLFAMGDPRPAPGVACRACGRSWRDLGAFIAAAG